MKTGRPRSFKNDADFVTSMYEYLSHCDEKGVLPNIAGFCVFTHINRDTFYAQKELYSDTFKRVNDILEDSVLTNKHVSDTMKIFYLKNKFGYRDRYDQVVNSHQEVTIKQDMSKLSEEELTNLLELTRKIENDEVTKK